MEKQMLQKGLLHKKELSTLKKLAIQTTTVILGSPQACFWRPSSSGMKRLLQWRGIFGFKNPPVPLLAQVPSCIYSIRSEKTDV
jgi:hypothetical protein